MFGYIYKSTNVKTGLIYVGQKRSDTFLGDRYLGSGKKLLEAVKKFGRDSFTVTLLEEVDREEDMKDKEEYWITKLNATDPNVGYNMVINGQVNRNPGLSGPLNPFYGQKHSEASRKKMSEGQRRRTDDRTLSAETKQKIREALLNREVTWGHKLSANAKVNPNYGMKGKHLPDEAKAKQSAAMTKLWEDETRRLKQSQAVIDKWKDPEYRLKHIESMQGKKKVIRYKECPTCGRAISLSNFSRHVVTHNQ